VKIAIASDHAGFALKSLLIQHLKEGGRIVEVGRHEDLVTRPDGPYATLYQMQLLESRRERRVMPS